MRKFLMGAIAVSAILAVAMPAVAQTPESTFKSTVLPRNAGTTQKPANTAFRIDLTLNKPGTTVEFIDLKLPKTLKLSGKGLNSCTVQDLEFDPASCNNAKAGPPGRATAAQGPPATAVPISFAVQPYVRDAKTLLFFVVGQGGLAVQSPITAKLTNKWPQPAPADPRGAAPAGRHRRLADGPDADVQGQEGQELPRLQLGLQEQEAPRHGRADLHPAHRRAARPRSGDDEGQRQVLEVGR